MIWTNPFHTNMNEVQDLFKKGIALMKDNMYKEAESVYDLCVQMCLNNKYCDQILSRSYLQRGFARFFLDNHENALLDIKEAVRLDPTDEKTVVGFAKVLEVQNRPADALAAYEFAFAVTGQQRAKKEADLIKKRLHCYPAAIRLPEDDQWLCDFVDKQIEDQNINDSETLQKFLGYYKNAKQMDIGFAAMDQNPQKKQLVMEMTFFRLRAVAVKEKVYEALRLFLIEKYGVDMDDLAHIEQIIKRVAPKEKQTQEYPNSTKTAAPIGYADQLALAYLKFLMNQQQSGSDQLDAAISCLEQEFKTKQKASDDLLKLANNSQPQAQLIVLEHLMHIQEENSADQLKIAIQCLKDAFCIENSSSSTTLQELCAPKLKELGNDAVKQQQYEEADHCYTEAISYTTDKQDLAVLHANRGQARRLMNQMQPAVTDLKTAIELDPTYEKAHLRLGAVFEQLGNGAEARAVYLNVLERFPDSKTARDALGKLGGLK